MGSRSSRASALEIQRYAAVLQQIARDRIEVDIAESALAGRTGHDQIHAMTRRRLEQRIGGLVRACLDIFELDRDAVLREMTKWIEYRASVRLLHWPVAAQ